MKAYTQRHSIEVLTEDKLETGNSCLTTSCTDYDDFKSLPRVVAYQGVHFALTGWNSDRNLAYYQSGKPVAHKVR